MKAIFPTLVIFASVVIAAIPWGLPGEATFILPSITMLLIFLFCAMPQRLVPPWLVFLAGLATDILTAGPAGYWAMIYLLTYTLARQFAGGRRLRGAAHIWLSFAATGALAGACAWAIASLYYFRLIEWQPIAFGVGAAVGLLPLAGWLVRHPAFRSRRRVRGGWQMSAGEAK